MIHLILGNTGAGKTTYALSLKEKEQGVIFSIDHWNKTLFLADKTSEDGVDWFLERIHRSDTMIQSLVVQLASHNIPFQIHFLDIPLEIRTQRVKQRNQEKGATFQFEVSETDMEFMETWFEKPTPNEVADALIINT